MAEIAVYSDIDRMTGFGPQMLRDVLSEAAGEPVKVRMSSQGGNVIDGLTCYNLLKSYPGETTVVIDGMALSIASVFACGADRVEMAENAWFMIHNPHNEVSGESEDLRAMASLLDGMRDQLANAYSAKSKKPKDEILQLMDAETWMTGPQAKEAGFVDEITASLDVAAEFDASRFSKPPQTQHKETAMAAATYQELKSAFPKAKAEFITGCLDRDFTLENARAEYDAQTAKAMEETSEELAKAKAEVEKLKKEAEAKAAEDEKKEAEAKAEEEEAAQAKARSGVTAVASGKGKGKGKSGHTATARFHEAVNERVKLGATKAQAMSGVINDDPELHSEFLQENRSRD